MADPLAHTHQPHQHLLPRTTAHQRVSPQVLSEFTRQLSTLIGAGVYSLYKQRALLSFDDVPMFATGLVVSFFSAWICVRWLLKYIASHSFEVFAWYRIGFGLLVLVTAWTGTVNWTG